MAVRVVSQSVPHSKQYMYGTRPRYKQSRKPEALLVYGLVSYVMNTKSQETKMYLRYQCRILVPMHTHLVLYWAVLVQMQTRITQQYPRIIKFRLP